MLKQGLASKLLGDRGRASRVTCPPADVCAHVSLVMVTARAGAAGPEHPTSSQLDGLCPKLCSIFMGLSLPEEVA